MKIEEIRKLSYEDRIQVTRFISFRWPIMLSGGLIKIGKYINDENNRLLKYIQEFDEGKKKMCNYDLQFWNMAINEIYNIDNAKVSFDIILNDIKLNLKQYLEYYG